MKSRISVLVGTASIFVASAASAGFETQNWSFFDNAGGSGSQNDSLMSVAGGNSGTGGVSLYYTTAYTSGTVSVDWSFNNTDIDNGYDYLVYYVNGSVVDVTTGSGSGMLSLSINEGDVYGFGVRTVDGIFGAGFAEFANFVPTPGAFAVLGLAGLTRSRRRR